MTRDYEDNKKGHDGFWESPSGKLLLAVLTLLVAAGCIFAVALAVFGRFIE